MQTDTTKSKSLIAKLAEVMGEIDHVEKKGRNDFHKYDYVKAADLANIVRRKLVAHQILMLSDVVEVRHYETKNRKDEPMYGIDLKVKYTFFDGESDAQVSFHGYGSALDSGDKAAYKAHTGALKYALRNAFLVPDEKADPEKDASVDEAMAAPDPFEIKGRVSDVKPKSNGDDEQEVWLKVHTKAGDYGCVCRTEPSMSRLLDSEGKNRELLVVPASGKALRFGKSIHIIQQVFPLPDDWTDMVPILKESIEMVQAKKANGAKQ